MRGTLKAAIRKTTQNLDHIMPQEIRFATFNVCNLALPGTQYANDRPL
jgi:hypothetical protein